MSKSKVPTPRGRSGARRKSSSAKTANPLRDVILRRIKELGVSRYAVANAAGLGVSHQTVYKFLSGRQDARSETVAAIMGVLDLRVVSGDSPKVSGDAEK